MNTHSMKHFLSYVLVLVLCSFCTYTHLQSTLLSPYCSLYIILVLYPSFWIPISFFRTWSLIGLFEFICNSMNSKFSYPDNTNWWWKLSSLKDCNHSFRVGIWNIAITSEIYLLGWFLEGWVQNSNAFLIPELPGYWLPKAEFLLALKIFTSGSIPASRYYDQSTFL